MKCPYPRQSQVLGLILALAILSFLPLPLFASSAQAPSTITGTVFQDYNANGVKDSGGYLYSGVVAPAVDQGISGVTVTSIDSTGATVSTTTAADGTYSLIHNGSGTLRVEFSGFSSAYQPGPNGGAIAPDGAPAGVIQAGTLVQFVSATGTANLGLIRPEEYCQNNPQLAYACYKSGDPLGGGTAGTAGALFAIPYNASGTTPAQTTFATGVQIGTIWGEAWQRDTKQLFTSAFVKRHAGLGTLGTGGIYVTNLSTGSPVVSSYIDVKTLGIDTGNFAAARGLPANSTTPSIDIPAFAEVGKLGIGGIALSDDGATLWLTNLKNRTLYSINIGNPAKASAALVAGDVTSYAATAPWLTASPCTNGVARPFGVKYYRGKVYVGVVCTAESGGTINDLKGIVYALDPGTAAFTTILNMPLNFKRGLATSRVSGSNFWFPWTDTYSDATFRPGTVSDCCGGLQISRPMPMLSDIEFDASGTMILGYGDRDSHQFGNGHPRPVAGDTAVLYGTSGGDILRACLNAGGTYVLESNGSCGGQAGSGVGNGQGPGNGEFYASDNFNTTDHQETSNGGLAYLPGSQLTEMSGSDPLAYNSGGVYWLNNANGTSSRRYETYLTTNTTTFGKAAGLGDLTLLCDSAPIEIGNRIWRDDNGDGVQDPAEPGIASVTVKLYAPDGTTVLASAVTDASGAYYFSSASGTSTGSAKYGITGLTANTTGFSVRLDNPADYAAAGPLVGLLLSPPDITANGQDQRDSDATTVAGFPRVSFATSGHGANNHSYDIGFATFSLGNRVWFDTNNNGLLDGGETGIATVTVSLFADANTDGVPDSGTALATSSTDVNGYYRFDTLLADSYLVRIDPINFQPGGPLVGLFSSIPTVAAPNNDIDSDDNGIDNANQAANGILSGPVTLGPSATEPTSEADLSTSGQGAADNQANMTVDFGFYQKLSLGNFVWYDTNDNGQYDAGEQPISGVKVRLFADTNGSNTPDVTDTIVGSDQTTDASGHYLFTGLDAGVYFVQILSTNFSSGGVLVGYTNSSGAFPGDANDNKDHGTPVAGQGVVSEPVTLTNGGESITDGDTDSNTNLTIDFGFYQLAVGDQLWRDDNNNGQIDVGEPNLSGVRVELYDSTNTLVAVTTTDTNGRYLFDHQTDSAGVATDVGLVVGDYYITIPASQFTTGSLLDGYFSSTANDPGDAIDNNDNGIDAAAPASSGVRSATFTLTPGSEPTVTNANGTTSNPTIDFSFYTMSLGNLVWLDTNNNGHYDAGESKLQSVVVNLYYDVNTNSTIDGGETTPIATTTTDTNGEYLFTGLTAGNYVVELASSNFAFDGIYKGYYSSIGASGSFTGPYEPAPDPDTDATDNDDNGTVNGNIVVVNNIQSAMVTLVAGTEPDSTIETGGNSIINPAPDTNSNLTVDFGLLASVAIGNRVWIDTNNNGLLDPGESYVPDGVIVNLYYDVNGNNVIDGAETTRLLTINTISGEYGFGPLVPGNYMVELDAANFQPGGLLAGYTSSTGTNGSATGPSEPAPDPDSEETDDDDKGNITGTLGSGGSIRSALTTLTFRGEPTGEGSSTPFGLDFDLSYNATVDFGVFTPASLGDYVWSDLNRNGVQDVGEPPVQGVTVTLYRSSDDSVVATTTTDVNGYYQFTNLAPDTYRLGFSTLPVGFVFTLQDQGGNDAIDSDANLITGETADVVLAAGASDQTIDAGIYNDVRASIGDYVWYDLNENGVQDVGDQGLAGVTVQLYDSANTLLATTTTNTDGAYLFSNLLLGDYYIVVTPPVNYAFSPQDVGGNTAASDVTDSDADPTTGRMITTNLLPNETDLSWDAGLYYTKVALGNRVWKDTNNDGQDNGFGGGLPSVTVNLYLDTNNDGTPDGGIVQTTTTDANGFYLFTGLDPNTYIVEVIPPVGYISSTGAPGLATGPYEPAPDPDNDINEDDNGTTVGTAVRSGPITLTRNGEPLGEATAMPNPDMITPDFNSNLTVDFGLFQPLSLGNQVWYDANNNGIIDGTESGVAGVTVNLYDASNTLITSMVTDLNGNYLFTNLGRGDYTVEIVLPTGYVSSTDIASSAAPNNNTDNDDNGVVVSGGTVRSSTVSMFPNNEPADDPGYPIGNANRNPTVDFGIYQPLSLGNLVWNDVNNNGMFDGLEAGINGVTVNLYLDANTNGLIDAGEFVASQTTSGGGLYLFTNLAPGDYLVELPASNFTTGQPLAHFASSTGGGSEPAPTPNNDVDSDDNGTTQADMSILSLPITLTSGGELVNDGDGNPNTNLSVDFGVYPLASLGDYVWLDTNKDGLQDASESGVVGVTVQLYQPGPDSVAGTADDLPIATTTTGVNGAYQFLDLVPGDYFVQFSPPLGYAFSVQNSASATPTTDSDADVTTGQTIITTLAPGENDTSWDAGLIYTASLGDRVWLDQNGNGIQDTGEPGLAGATVTLFTSAGVQVGPSVTSDVNGNYAFTNLPPDDYYLVVTPPSGYTLTLPNQGGDDTADSDADPTTGRTATFTLVLNQSDPTWDAGTYHPVSLGNQVWLDRNDNGVIDAGEPGLGGITVQLFASDGVTEIPVGPDGVLGTADDAVGGMATDGAGNYLFANLAPGDYIVSVTTPSGASSSTDIGSSATPNNDVDSDDNGVVVSAGTVRSGVVTLTTAGEPTDDPGQPVGNADRNPTVDFGFYQPLSLGNLVWNDANNSGDFDGTEVGIDGVVVNLYRDANHNGLIDTGEFVTSQVTSGGGKYLFTGLQPGEYLVNVPAGNFAAGAVLEHFASSTGGNSEPAPDTDTDVNNADSGTAQPDGSILSLPITLFSGTEPINDDDIDANTNLTVDFGVYPLASIGDYVWLDTDGDGVQDASESGLAGITVQLFRAGIDGIPNSVDDFPAGTVTTGANGAYQFLDLVPADYYVEFALPIGYKWSPQNSASATPTTDSDADVTTGQTIITTLAPGENDTSWDAGLIYTASLGDRVWLDQNGNGIQDAGEPGLAGATVTLFTSAGVQVGTPQTTDANGNYAFTNLPPDDYYLVVTPPTGYAITLPNQGGDDTADSDADPTTGRTATFTLALNQSDPTWDVGIYHPVSLGNQVWLDRNDNGVIDAGEPGLGGITVQLFASDGVTEIPVGPDGVLGTADDAVGGMATDGAGNYLFANLAPGGYIVSVTTPSGASSSTDIGSSATPNNDVDSDDNGVIVSGSTVRSGIVTLTTGGEPTDDPIQTVGNADRNPTVDFGFYQPLSLGNLVWNDANNNGVLDGGEVGLDGVTVNLYRDANLNGLIDAGELVSSQVTSGGGKYLFTGLRPGDYLVELPASNFAAGQPLAHFASSTGGASEPAVDPDTDIDNDDNGTAQPDTSILSQPITLASGSEPTSDGDGDPNTNLSVDFGVYPLASIGNYVWADVNQDGVQDPSEQGVVGATVQLYQPGIDGLIGTADDLLVATTTTGANGAYQFTDLAIGDYFVQFGLPLGYTRSPQDSASATDATDSDANVTTGQTVITTLAPGENDTSWDAGLIYTTSLGDRVWLDQNGNGIQDAGELGLAGATITLYTSAGVQVGPSVTSDVNGNYAFTNLPPGDYYLIITSPSGYVITQPNQGSDDTVDSDADPATGKTSTITIALGQADPNWDIGMYHPLSLGNLVWNDINNNGVVDGVESGIDGVVVNLYRDANGNGAPEASELVGTQTTSNGGLYTFINLAPGSYLVQIDPSNFSGAGKLVGYNSSTGSIGTNMAVTGPYEPAPGPDNNINNDDNGTLVTNQGIVSKPITLTSDSEPVTDDDADPNSNLTLDFGVFQPASLGNVVWSDTNKNGVRDPGEPGVGGVTVTLYNSNGNPIATTTTDATGNYQFTNLPPGTYSVGFSDLPADTTFTLPNQGGNDATDSDVDPASGRTNPIILVPGQNNPTIFTGLIPITPTAITLTSFTATREGDQVVVRWVTTAELDTWGFHLYRSVDGRRDHAVQVTPTLIPGQGRGQGGASYSWTDTDITAGASYSYWLVETELSGATHEYGPAQVSLQPAGSYQVFLPVVRR